jgi:hypothetical protein
MSGWLLLVVAAIYSYVAGEQFYKGNIGIAAAFVGYTISNLGLYYVSK